MTSDNLGNMYIITLENGIEKYSSSGHLMTRYSGNRNGQALWLDVSNPMKVLVWYPDFREILFLDRSLTPLGTLNLIKAGFPEVRCMAAAQDGNIWIYDEMNFRVIKITPEGEKRFESLPLNQMDYTPQTPFRMIEEGNALFMADGSAGIGIFDAFAQFDQSFKPEMPFSDFFVQGGVFYLLTDSSIVIHQGRLSVPRLVKFAHKAINKTSKWLGIRKLFLMNSEGIEVWSF